MKKSRLLRAVGACLLAFCAVTTAQAAIITFSATGIVNDISGFSSSPTEFSIGDTLTLTYTFDSSTPDSSATSTIGFYQGAVISATATVGSYTASATGGNIKIYNNHPILGDVYNVSVFPVTGASVAGSSLSNIYLNLRDTSRAAIDSDALTAAPPIPADYTNINFSIEFFHGEMSEFATVSTSDMQISSITTVPVPPAIWLFGSGLLGLIGITRKKAS